MPGKRLSEETKELIQSFYNKGMPIKKIVKTLNVPYSTVYARTIVKKKGFSSQWEYAKFLDLRKDYMVELLELEKDLSRIGYPIEGVREEEGNLVVKLLREKKDFDKDSVEANFKEGLKECLQFVGIEENDNFEVSYEENTVFIEPNNLKLRAFLYAYKPILERELVK